MAKLKAPLFSFGASGQLGKALVFFPWKGLHVVRSHVVPTNPNTPAQIIQRAYMTTIVDHIHAMQVLGVNGLDSDDVIAYAALAGIEPTPRTWFNQIVKGAIDQYIASLQDLVCRNGTSTPGAGTVGCELWATTTGVGAPTAGDFWYGTTRTALINSQVAVVVADKASATLGGLTTGTKYFWQYRPTAPAGQVGNRSGIYYAVAA